MKLEEESCWGMPMAEEQSTITMKNRELPRLYISKIHSGVVLPGKAVISAAFCDVVIAI